MNSKKCVVSIIGIRPDFVRTSEILKKLDKEFNHICIRTDEYRDTLVAYAFFGDLKIRCSDYYLESTDDNTCTFYCKLFVKMNISPELIIFVGDSDVTCLAKPFKQKGYKICHIEAGMRSHNKNMCEEHNKIICDQYSDLLFAYHYDNKKELQKENITKNVYVVGNTVFEVVNKLFDPSKFVNDDNYDGKTDSDKLIKRKDMILVDIHREENLNSKNRMINIIKYLHYCYAKYNLPINILFSHKLENIINKFNLNMGIIKFTPLKRWRTYLNTCYHSLFVVSDSGTAQEELGTLNVPVIVPRDYTERPQSYDANMSIYLNINSTHNKTWLKTFDYIDNIHNKTLKMNLTWLGDGDTSNIIIKHIQTFLDLHMTDKLA
jgi:UDP-N-acetylglucosamine 2-epimerase